MSLFDGSILTDTSVCVVSVCIVSTEQVKEDQGEVQRPG